jgi:hypothetical protein
MKLSDLSAAERNTIVHEAQSILLDQKLVSLSFKEEFEAGAAAEERQLCTNRLLSGINQRNNRPQFSQAEKAEHIEAARLKRLYNTFEKPVHGLPFGQMVAVGNAEAALNFRKFIESTNTPRRR